MVNCRIRWRWTLSIGQVLLAVGLAYFGKLEDRTFRAQMEQSAAAAIPEPGTISFIPLTSWGHVPRSYQILLAIDFPAGLALVPIKLLNVKEGVFTRAWFLAGVLILWWWVGSRIDFRRSLIIERRAARLVAASVGLMVSAGFGVATLFSYWGHTPLAHTGGMIWCLIGVIYFARMLRRTGQAANESSQAHQ